MANPEGIRQAMEQATSAQAMTEVGGNGEDDDALLPAGLKPPRGAQVFRFSFTADETLSGTEQVIVMWQLTVREERLASERARRGSEEKHAWETVKSSIRAINGEVMDWGAGKADAAIDRMLDDIGPKGRQLLLKSFSRMSNPSEDEEAAFFERMRVGTAT